MYLTNSKTRSGKQVCKLTNDRIHKLKVGNVDPATKKEVQNRQKIYNGSGLYIQVSDSGKKIFRYKYYVSENGKNRSVVVTIGDFSREGNDFDCFTVEQAEARYRRAMVLLKNENVDPKEALKLANENREKEQVLDKRTFRVCAQEWLDKQTTFTAGHRAKVQARLFNDCFPVIGEIPIRDVTKDHLVKIVNVVVGRMAIDTAHRLVACVGKIFDDEFYNGNITSDPSRGMKDRLPVVQRKHFKAVTEPDQFREVLIDIENISATLYVKTALRLLPHLNVRQMELRHARWQDIDMVDGLWRLRKAKKKGRSIADEGSGNQEKDYIVPLSKQVISILNDLRHCKSGSEFVFPGLDSITRPVSNMSLGRALKRAGIVETTPHGFRSTFKTICSELFEIDQNVTEHMLSHNPRTDPYGYFRGSYLPQRRALAQIWSDYLEQLVKGMPDIPGLRQKYDELVKFYQKSK